MMRQIIFDCETITPMFLYGADGKTVELRAPSLKAMMRFWWRSIHPNLTLKELKKRESEIFGGTTDQGNKSSFNIRISYEGILDTSQKQPLPHKLQNDKKSFKREALNEGFKFNVIFSFYENKVIKEDYLINLFQLTSILGGLGNRSRRGFGAYSILKNEGKTDCLIVDITEDSITQLIQELNPGFKLESNYELEYPWIKKIIIGETTHSNLVEKIGKATNDIKSNNKSLYEKVIGNSNPRFASPIYISVIKSKNNDLLPIITHLFCKMGGINEKDGLALQQKLINEVLK